MCVCVHTSLHCAYVILVLMFQNYDSSSEKHNTSRNHGKTGHNEQGLTPHADHARQPNVCPDFLFLATHPHSGCGPYAFLLLLLQSSIVEFFLLIFFFTVAYNQLFLIICTESNSLCLVNLFIILMINNNNIREVS